MDGIINPSTCYEEALCFNPFSVRGPIYWPPLCLQRMQEADVLAHFFQALQ
jgi:hypothetical protein